MSPGSRPIRCTKQSKVAAKTAILPACCAAAQFLREPRAPPDRPPCAGGVATHRIMQSLACVERRCPCKSNGRPTDRWTGTLNCRHDGAGHGAQHGAQHGRSCGASSHSPWDSCCRRHANSRQRHPSPRRPPRPRPTTRKRDPPRDHKKMVNPIANKPPRPNQLLTQMPTGRPP